MKKGDLIFVYGTLRKGERKDLSNSMEVTPIGDDHINGFIYDIGAYPGAKVEPGHFDPSKPTIVGDVFRIRTASIITALDMYEGYPSLYNRVETETAHGRHVWVYTFNPEVTEDMLIESGDWQKRHVNTVTEPVAQAGRSAA